MAERARDEDLERVIMAGAFVVVSFCGSLRGPETLMVDLAGLREFWAEGPAGGESRSLRS